MLDGLDAFFYKVRYFTAGLFLVACLFIASALLPAASNYTTRSAQTGASSIYDSSEYTSANAVTRGLLAAGNFLGQAAEGMQDTVHGSLGFTTNTVGSVFSVILEVMSFLGLSLINGIQFALGGIGAGLVFLANMTGNMLVFIVSLPINLVQAITKVPMVSAVTRPSATLPVPAIEPYAVAQAEEAAPLPAAQPANEPAQPASTRAAWPVPGNITTYFGVPHWPYQPRHTGLDISTGQRSGVMPVKAFKPGRVIAAGYSSNGFGNNVIIDHGGGMTTLYGHLASVSVQKGQQVDQNAVLGREGSTGVSTGPHVHFEVRLNEQPVNPLPFLDGRP